MRRSILKIKKFLKEACHHGGMAVLVPLFVPSFDGYLVLVLHRK